VWSVPERLECKGRTSIKALYKSASFIFSFLWQRAGGRCQNLTTASARVVFASLWALFSCLSWVTVVFVILVYNLSHSKNINIGLGQGLTFLLLIARSFSETLAVFWHCCVPRRITPCSHWPTFVDDHKKICRRFVNQNTLYAMGVADLYNACSDWLTIKKRWPTIRPDVCHRRFLCRRQRTAIFVRKCEQAITLPKCIKIHNAESYKYTIQ